MIDWITRTFAVIVSALLVITGWFIKKASQEAKEAKGMATEAIKIAETAKIETQLLHESLKNISESWNTVIKIFEKHNDRQHDQMMKKLDYLTERLDQHINTN